MRRKPVDMGGSVESERSEERGKPLASFGDYSRNNSISRQCRNSRVVEIPPEPKQIAYTADNHKRDVDSRARRYKQELTFLDVISTTCLTVGILISRFIYLNCALLFCSKTRAPLVTAISTGHIPFSYESIVCGTA